MRPGLGGRGGDGVTAGFRDAGDEDVEPLAREELPESQTQPITKQNDPIRSKSIHSTGRNHARKDGNVGRYTYPQRSRKLKPEQSDLVVNLVYLG